MKVITPANIRQAIPQFDGTWIYCTDGIISANDNNWANSIIEI